MSKNISNQCILILDFGSQYTQLIARRVREIGVYCKLMNWNADKEDIYQFNPRGIILSGGPESVTKINSPRISQYIFDSGVPIFGICYGMQVMAEQLGGKVISSDYREFGYASVKITNNSNLLFQGLKEIQDVWMSHGDQVIKIPDNFLKIAETNSCFYSAIADEEKKYYGVQFHPEVTHTKNGVKILANFVLNICNCKRLWTSSFIIENAITYIKNLVGKDEVILGLSGGLDSSVTAMLVQKAIGNKLTCVFIDNGLLRLNESIELMAMFSSQFHFKIIHVNAEDRFLSALKGIHDPEKKRMIIGSIFIDVFNEEAKKLKNANWLAQGTIYPDIIESAASKIGKSHSIKSHHNVAGLPDSMEMGLVEPLRELFKDEVRQIGLELGLPSNMLYRHPFPGPGLAVRVLGEIKKEYCDLLRKTDIIFIQELYRAKLYDKVSQAFCVFLPIRSVGVMGDTRKYDWVISLRAVETIDFMTARWAHLPYDFLNKVSNRIINEVEGISRVVYDISGKPPATIEWE
ncbi:GMP synthase [Candidatus Photodesmus katoptron]|uniref:GMP synthase [glutamine-hydrolyzing] n=1 Tax=Candidatus Photodesmus katoptron Akat1 TaxID=1236703 RepID=S3DZK0_9GAMM|nr:glutamine-hydrolyzing GMP synthase [Candidatus Photodesmus katoptron]EPE37351.1 GMP synthase [Candidatus Photodesmus katoptron Akat1]KEY89978.1 GMP synthase [Candidatus Photodesmus katoptron]